MAEYMRVFGNWFQKQSVTFCTLIDECVREKVSFSPGEAMLLFEFKSSRGMLIINVQLCNLQRAFFYMVYLQ